MVTHVYTHREIINGIFYILRSGGAWPLIREGANRFSMAVQNAFPPGKVWADGQYTGDLLTWFKKKLKLYIEIVLRSDDVKGFAVLPSARLWNAPLFGWEGISGRNVTTSSIPVQSESMVYVTMTQPTQKAG